MKENDSSSKSPSKEASRFQYPQGQHRKRLASQTKLKLHKLPGSQNEFLQSICTSLFQKQQNQEQIQPLQERKNAKRRTIKDSDLNKSYDKHPKQYLTPQYIFKGNWTQKNSSQLQSESSSLNKSVDITSSPQKKQHFLVPVTQKVSPLQKFSSSDNSLHSIISGTQSTNSHTASPIDNAQLNHISVMRTQNNESLNGSMVKSMHQKETPQQQIKKWQTSFHVPLIPKVDCKQNKNKKFQEVNNILKKEDSLIKQKIQIKIKTILSQQEFDIQKQQQSESLPNQDQKNVQSQFTSQLQAIENEAREKEKQLQMKKNKIFQKSQGQCIGQENSGQQNDFSQSQISFWKSQELKNFESLIKKENNDLFCELSNKIQNNQDLYRKQRSKSQCKFVKEQLINSDKLMRKKI